MTTTRAFRSPDELQALADAEGVCSRPILKTVLDRATGEVVWIPLPCGSTREHVCRGCADKARRLRIHQCLAGWHLDHEPDTATNPDTQDDGDLEDEPPPADESQERAARSTRRRDDVPDLPRVPVEDRTIGTIFEGNNGRIYRPSMFVTLTLPSYGPIGPGTGVPLDPATYNYRRAALDAMHLPRLLDRWFQNLRRCAGYKVQYFGAVEAQRRLAPHFHVALRGAIPRHIIRQVTRGTYATLWWPAIGDVVYPDTPPVWDGRDYLDPVLRWPLPTWDQATRPLDRDDAKPMHVLRFGTQTDIQGLLGGTPDSDRTVRYLTKYLTKAVADTYAPAEGDQRAVAYERHIDRLHHEVRFLPCTPECGNWLRYGIQPRNPGPGLTPGQCPAPAHQRENLGLGGRRVLVSRGWSGKTLARHKADRAAVVRAALEEHGIAPPDIDRMAADTLTTDGEQRFVWSTSAVPAGLAAAFIMHAIYEKRRWRAEYDAAKLAHTAARGPGPPVETISATKPTHPEGGTT